jgi:hypothetical protein
MLAGIKILRQIGGFILRNVTFRLSMSAVAAFFGGADFTKGISLALWLIVCPDFAV